MIVANEDLGAGGDGPEVSFSTAKTSRNFHYAEQRGRLRRIARGMFTSNLDDPLEAVVLRNNWRIAAHLFPGAVVVDRSAVEMQPAPDGSFTLAGSRARDVQLPGLRLRVREGDGPLAGDKRWMGEELFMSSRARAFLENCRPSRAGATHFVQPAFVEGTLRESWRLYEGLAPGFARAAFAMFVVSEVHPFADGNGRVARLLLNAELTADGQQRIIVPNSLRGDYLSGLRAMTHNAYADTYVKVLSWLQAFTINVDFASRESAELDLYRQRAFDDPSQQPGMLDHILKQAKP